MKYDSIAELITAAEQKGLTIGETVLLDQAAEACKKKEDLLREMDARLTVMEEAVKKGYESKHSLSGLTGGDGLRMKNHASEALMGRQLSLAVARAVAVAEYNAAMGKIVAAPTAGSCGIMPGCLISMMEDHGLRRDRVLLSMFTAGAIGMVIASRASVAGASGGCQAECGSAAAMTAAALVEMMGGTPSACGEACAISLKNQLGLVCDPVAGLVEIPCIKRNAQGVVTAFLAADMALAGVTSHIPADEVIDAMKEIGDALPCSLKETAEGGLAATPTGQRIRKEIFGKE